MITGRSNAISFPQTPPAFIAKFRSVVCLQHCRHKSNSRSWSLELSLDYLKQYWSNRLLWLDLISAILRFLLFWYIVGNVAFKSLLNFKSPSSYTTLLMFAFCCRFLGGYCFHVCIYLSECGTVTHSFNQFPSGHWKPFVYLTWKCCWWTREL